VAGRNGVLALTVANAGPADSGPLTAAVKLPPGVTANSVSGTGWSAGSAAKSGAPAAGTGAQPAAGAGAQPAAAGAEPTAAGTAIGNNLTGPSVAKSGTTTAYIAVSVAADATAGGIPTVTVTGTAPGSTSGAPISSPTGVVNSGLGAEVVTTAHAGVYATGNTLLSCPTPSLICHEARHRSPFVGPQLLLNDNWPMRPYDADNTDLTAASSSATLTLPAGSTVAWAGLYWSGTTPYHGPPPALLRHGDGSYQTVHSSRVDTTMLWNEHTYQAFADVTDLVTSGGTWEVGLPDKPQCGETAYAGWSLVVIAKSDALPERQVAVFDGLHAVDSGTPLDFPLGEAPAGSAQISTVAWEGDDGLTGDQVDIDGAPLAPCPGEACDMEHSESSGSDPPGWNTFGTDVHSYPVMLQHGGTHTIGARSQQDLFSLGVVGAVLPVN